jgi:hypothetical protein
VVKEKNIIDGMIKSNKKSGGYLSMTERIAIVTGGGDCPGLNTVIRAVVKAAARVGGGWFPGWLRRHVGTHPVPAARLS